MGEDKQPATKAVREAQDWNVTIWWELSIAQRDSDGGYRTAIKVREAGNGPEFKSTAESDALAYRPTTNEDAAAALRDIADALSPDTEKRALEIAARLGASLLIETDQLGTERVRVADDVLGALWSAASAGETAGWTSPDFAKLQSNIAIVAEGVRGGRARRWLQQARDFFAQAEEEVADEKLTLTIDRQGRNIYQDAAGNTVLNVSAPPPERSGKKEAADE